MPRPKSTTTASKDEKILEATKVTKTVTDNEKKVEVESSEKVKVESSEKEDKTKTVKLNFTDTDDVTIISLKRAGKSITALTLDVITFDEKGKATCKGLNARYLLESGLGFELAK